MANKRVIRPKRVMSGVVITIMRVSTIMDFYVVLQEDGVYPMILGRPHQQNDMQGTIVVKDT